MKVVLKLSKNNSLTNTLNASVNKTLLLLLLSRNKHIHTQERGDGWCSNHSFKIQTGPSSLTKNRLPI